MPALSQWRGDLRVLWHMLRGMPAAASHAERLQAFYQPQADQYDAFRERLLPGRREMISRMPLPDRARIVELGGGTGRNIEYFGSRIDGVESFELVDLCPALLERTRDRFRTHPQIRVVEADATTYQPRQPVDCVYFSFALTMIPDWRAALRNAWAMLKPGGVLGVVDFYVSDAATHSGRVAHSRLERAFWTRWFAHDGVHLNPEHLPALRDMFAEREIVESRTAVPFLPGIRVPYYIFVGNKRVTTDDDGIDRADTAAMSDATITNCSITG